MDHEEYPFGRAMTVPSVRHVRGMEMTAFPAGATTSHIAVGDVLLEVNSRTLHGPAGTVRLCPAAFAALAKLMRRPGVTVPLGDLIEAMWGDPDVEPSDPERAVRMRVGRARAALTRVGAPDDMLQSVFQVGYQIDGLPRIIRAFTPAQAAALETLIATHPDQALAAALIGAAA